MLSASQLLQMLNNKKENQNLITNEHLNIMTKLFSLN